MNDFAKLELELVASARGAIEPGPQDRARLREALGLKISAIGAAASTPSLGVSRPRPLRHVVNSHVVALSSVAGIVGALSFGAGYYVGHRASKVIVKTVTAAQPQPVAVNASPTSESSHALDSPSLTSSLDWGHNSTRLRVTPSAAPGPQSQENSLAEELDFLRRAEHTIRSGNYPVALGLLRELDERFPKGHLLEERTAARVMANCQLDDIERAHARGNAYLLAHPQSMYADRVRALCQIDSAQPVKDSPKTGD